MIWALHGNLGTTRDWTEVIESLPERDPFLIEPVDLWSPGPTDFGAWSYRLNDLVSATDPCPIVMGYSLGGRLAMHCVTGLDTVWQGAVFVSAHPGLPDESARQERLRQDQDWAAKLRTRGTEAFLRSWNQQPVLAGNPISPDQASIVAEQREAIAQAFDLWCLGREDHLLPGLAESAIPQLWVVGADDAKFRALAEDAVARIPGARLVVIPGCGHRVLLENPRELAEAVREFVESITGD